MSLSGDEASGLCSGVVRSTFVGHDFFGPPVSRCRSQVGSQCRARDGSDGCREVHRGVRWSYRIFDPWSMEGEIVRFVDDGFGFACICYSYVRELFFWKMMFWAGRVVYCEFSKINYSEAKKTHKQQFRVLSYFASSAFLLFLSDSIIQIQHLSLDFSQITSPVDQFFNIN